MIPGFDIEGGLPTALARSASVAGLVGAAGGLAYASVLRPAGLPDALSARLRRWCFWAVGTALAGALVWLLAQTSDMAGGVSPSDIWAVLSGTMFGHLVAARLGLLLLAGLALKMRSGAWATGLSCLALVLQAGHSHALAMGGSPWLLAASALHLLAAGVWLGGLPAFWLVMGAGPPALSRAAADRFSTAGLVCVGLLLATATVQYWRLVADIPGLVGTAYGWMVCVKLVLFAGLIALAARNRLRLTPGLPASVPVLRRAILLEVALGLAVLAAAGVLTGLQPAMHAQKLWPFPWIPSLDAAREDPDIAHEAMLAGAALVLSLAVLGGAAWLARRRRWPALAAALAACATGAAAMPHLSPLLVPAVPTLFYRSPSGFSTASIVHGGALYPDHCAACHGAAGHGDGPLAHTLPVPPADLDAPHLWMHADGELFWWLTHGIEGPRGGLVMPGFAALPDDDRWALIDFIRARNAGMTLGQAGWATQLQAPGFSAACPSGERPLDAMRGGIVGVKLGLAGHATVLADGVQCQSDDATVQAAYAIAAPGAAAVLIDANGWLRAASRGPQAPDPALASPPLPPGRATMDMPADMKM